MCESCVKDKLKRDKSKHTYWYLYKCSVPICKNYKPPAISGRIGSIYGVPVFISKNVPKSIVMPKRKLDDDFKWYTYNQIQMKRPEWQGKIR